MLQFNSLIDRIKTVGPNTFEALAIDIFKLQYTHNLVYKEWCDSLKKTPNLVERLEQVPFLPIEFFNNFKLSNSSFNDLVYNVSIVISLSLFFLLIFQTIIGNDNLILIEIKSITRSVSFSGFIVIPFLLFILQNLIVRYEKINRFLYSIVLFSWIFSSQFFL